jgi:peptidyl-prolyl cis-trans isomerase B (cyclophilin B)
MSRNIVSLIGAAILAAFATAQDGEAPRAGVKAKLVVARQSQAAFEDVKLTLTVSVDPDAAPLKGLRRSDLVRENSVVVAGRSRIGKWAILKSEAPQGAIDLLPGESFSLAFTVALPEAKDEDDGLRRLQWIGTGPLKRLRSDEATLTLRDATLPIATLETSEGTIVLELWSDRAPNHVANLIALAEKGFYDGLKWHRVVPNFVVQTGCPKGDGTGDPGYKIPAEFHDAPFTKGVLGMARGGEPDSAGSQFFICVADSPALNKNYTAFGRVLEGQDVADRISNVAKAPNTERPLTDVLLRKVVIARPSTYELPAVKKAGS